MSSDHKFSVIIPTRERADTLYHTLRTIIGQEYENLQIIVSDNFSQDNTREVVRSFSDQRLKYFNTGKRISMSENFEFGLSQVKGGFVMFIGDDDGLLPGAIQRINEIVAETKMQAVTSGMAYYVWPTHPSEQSRNKMGWSIKQKTEIRRSAKWIKKVLSFAPTYTFDLPGMYCGCVHIDVVSSMKKHGVFFHSQTPDAYSAFACAVAIDRYAFSHRPFAIHGASGRSNGASYFHRENKNESKLFFAENTIPFHLQLRVCPSFRMIAAETFLQLKDTFPEKTQQYKIDIYSLLGAVLHERNDVSGESIDLAVQEVIEQNTLDMKIVLRHHRSFEAKIRRFMYETSKIFPLWVKYSNITDTTKLGIANIYDAAKTMDIFFKINDGEIPSRLQKLIK